METATEKMAILSNDLLSYTYVSYEIVSPASYFLSDLPYL